MKIAVIVTCPPNPAAHWRRMENIALFLEKEGHDVELIHCVKKEKCTNEKAVVKNKYFAGNRFVLMFKLWSYVKKKKFDLLIGETHWGYLQALLCRFSTKVYFDMHGGMWEEYEMYNEGQLTLKYPKKLAMLYFLKFVDWLSLITTNKVLCVSRNMIKYLIDRGYSNNKMAYVTNGVDFNFFNRKNIKTQNVNKIRKEYKLRKKIVGYIGNFQKWQGAEKLLEAAKKFPDTDFIFVGTDEKYTKGNVHLLGKVPFADILDYYELCDLFVLPRPKHATTIVAAPTKFGEYCAMGKPVLTTNLGDAAELIRKYNSGIVVENNSPENLSSGIKQFFSLSKKERAQMSKNCQKLAKDEFDWKKIIKRIPL